MSPVRQVQARLSPFWLAPRNPNPAIAESKRNNRPRGLGVLDEKNLGFVNFVGNRQYITLGNLTEIANAHTAISRGRRCHLSQLNARERCRPPNVELCCHRVARDFFTEAGISKNY